MRLALSLDERLWLDDALPKTADLLAHELLKDRAVPPRRFAFRLAQRLKGLQRADDVFCDDPRVLRRAVSAFCRLLDQNPQDRWYGFDFSENGVEDFWLELVEAWPKVNA